MEKKVRSFREKVTIFEEVIGNDYLGYLAKMANHNISRYLRSDNSYNSLVSCMLDNYRNGFGEYKRFITDYIADYSVVASNYEYNPFSPIWDFSCYEILHIDGNKSNNNIFNHIAIPKINANDFKLSPQSGYEELISNDEKFLIRFNYSSNIYAWELVAIKPYYRKLFSAREKQGGLDTILYKYWQTRKKSEICGYHTNKETQRG